MNHDYRKPLPGTQLDYFDTRAAVEEIQPGAYDTLPYTSRVLAENLVRRCDPATLVDSLKQLIELSGMRAKPLEAPELDHRLILFVPLAVADHAERVANAAPRTGGRQQQYRRSLVAQHHAGHLA